MSRHPTTYTRSAGLRLVFQEFRRRKNLPATGRTDTGGLTDRQALHAVLSRAENRYLVRQLCWVMTIEGLDTYIVVPRELADYGLLVEALRPTPSPMDLDCLIGVRGPMAGPEVCNGLMVPIVAFDQLYSFDRDVLMKAIPRRENISAKAFAPAARSCSIASC